jgi:hypothetical protein
MKRRLAFNYPRSPAVNRCVQCAMPSFIERNKADGPLNTKIIECSFERWLISHVHSAWSMPLGKILSLPKEAVATKPDTKSLTPAYCLALGKPVPS